MESIDLNPSNPYLEIVSSIQQVLVAIWFLGRASIRTFIAFAKFLILWTHLLAPHTTKLLSRSWNYFRRLGPRCQILSIVCSVLVISVIRLWRQRVFHRIAKKGKKLIRRAYKTTTKCWHLFLTKLKRILLIIKEVFGVVLPVLTVIFPLRFYVSRNFFRRCYALVAFITSFWFSLKTLHEHYSQQQAKLNYTELDITASNKKGGRKSMWDGMFIKKESEVQPKKQSRKTVDATKSSLFSKRLFSDSDNNNNPSNHSKASPQTEKGSTFEAEVIISESDCCGVTIWLDYWVVASVFDLLMRLPILLCRLTFGRQKIPIKSVSFGYIEENVYADPRYFSNLWYQPKEEKLWSFVLADASTSAVVLLYELTISILLLFAVQRKHKYLIGARHFFVGLLDKFVRALTGVQFIPVSSEDSKSRQATKGLLPAAWIATKAYLPPSILFCVNLLAHVPQAFLLMLPSFLLPMVVFAVALLYPIVASMQTLEETSVPKQAYWLSYFALYSLLQAMLLRLLKNTRVWTWLPLTSHLELLAITTVQVICLSPQLLTKLVYARLPVTKRAKDSTVQAPSEPSTESAPHLRVKEEPSADEITPVRKMASLSTDQKASPDSTVIRHKRKSSFTPFTSNELNRPSKDRRKSLQPFEITHHQSPRKAFVPAASVSPQPSVSKVSANSAESSEAPPDGLKEDVARSQSGLRRSCRTNKSKKMAQKQNGGN